MVRITKRERTWQTWTGSADQLKRIGKAMEKSVYVRRDALIADYNRAHPPPEPVDDKESIGHLKYLDRVREIQRGREQIQAECGLRVSLTEHNRGEVSGPVEAVLAEFDRRTYRELTFEGVFPYRSVGRDELVLQLHRSTPHRAVALTVASSDRGWAKQALAEISEEVDSDKKWWGRFRTPFIFAAFGAICVMLHITLYLLFALLPWSELARAAVASACVAALAIGLGLSERMSQWIFPPLQGVTDGERPQDR